MAKQKKGYKYLDKITSDVMFEAYGKDLKELFENAALALLNVICKVDKIKGKEKEQIEVKAYNLEGLMINWLQAIIALVDTEQRFYHSIIIDEIDETHAIATLLGEPISPDKGETVVKAVTNYQFKVEKTKSGYVTRVSLDI